MKTGNQIQRTLDWNITRGNNTATLDWKLEIAMLQEELDELEEAVLNDSPVDIFDALMDLKFVLLGSCGKFGLSTENIQEGYEIVLQANETKPATKNSLGKIVKPANFPNPEPRLQLVLDQRV